MTIRRCQHIKVNGIQCGSPAKRNENYCYFHEECRVLCRQINMRFTEHGIIELPTLEDANSIQLGLGEVMRLLVTHQIDHKIASLLLRALRTAAANVKFLSLEPPPTQIVIDPKCVENRPLGATAWSTVEGQEYDLIPDLIKDLIKDSNLVPENGKTAYHPADTHEETQEDTQEANHHLAETARPAYTGTSELAQFELDILRLEAEGKHAEAGEIRRDAEPFFLLNPSRRSRTASEVPADKLDPGNSENDPEPQSPFADGLTPLAAS
jgi:hypothetical protein